MTKLLMLTGSLEWSLPEKVTHRAGDVLEVTFHLSNPTSEARSYQVFLALFDAAGGSAIPGTTGPITIDGADTFEVAAEGERTLAAPLKIDYTNAVMQASLYDVQSGEMALGLQARLEAPAGAINQLSPLMGFASGVLALGLVAGMVSNMTRR